VAISVGTEVAVGSTCVGGSVAVAGGSEVAVGSTCVGGSVAIAGAKDSMVGSTGALHPTRSNMKIARHTFRATKFFCFRMVILLTLQELDVDFREFIFSSLSFEIDIGIVVVLSVTTFKIADCCDEIVMSNM
jgi:hypothetical protein